MCLSILFNAEIIAKHASPASNISQICKLVKRIFQKILRRYSRPVQAEDYLLHLYRYTELNPARANMIADPADYHWSSYQITGLGKESELCPPTPNISGAA